MLGVGGQELFIIALVALILLGPERIPVFARGVARAYREFTRVRRSVDSTLTELKGDLELDLDDPPRPGAPGGRRVPLDQLHAYEQPAAKPEPFDVPPEDDYLGH